MPFSGNREHSLALIVERRINRMVNRHRPMARIEGAPAGTRGISLFVVPKIWVEEDGRLGPENDDSDKQ